MLSGVVLDAGFYHEGHEGFQCIAPVLELTHRVRAMVADTVTDFIVFLRALRGEQIGRASCRERV